MNVYFDTSCFGRPFDDRTIVRNAVEREAILAILERVERGELSLTISDVVVNEITRTPDEARREKLEELAVLASVVIHVTDEIRNRGAELLERGFRAFDALHIAAAESADVDYLCTADDSF